MTPFFWSGDPRQVQLLQDLQLPEHLGASAVLSMSNRRLWPSLHQHQRPGCLLENARTKHTKDFYPSELKMREKVLEYFFCSQDLKF